MTKRDELLALAERCEKVAAESSSYALECAIAEAIGAFATPPRNYTVSLDAAMTLVPEGWWLTLDRYSISDKAPDPFAWRVWLRRLVGDVDGDGACFHQEKFARATTPALALCAAALRARAEMEG